MKTLKLSVHSEEHIWLRHFFIARKKELDLSQRDLAGRLGVVYSFVGKVETGDRRLDIFEFISYCNALKLDPLDVLKEIKDKFYKDLTISI
ncbi:helix-turn-helix domain-containing protein [Acinetobacter ursingii]|uniref:helix-turn-helix domain-containing protein n=1 Tax=Acinetobacter ursingii TaxID=108980 RepID=UPI003AF81E84